MKTAPLKGAEAPAADDGLPALARLATDSGGRFTERSNDVGLGLARAQRDASCLYTLGFHEDDPRTDVMKSLRLRVKQPDLRVFHPSVLTARSEQAQRESLLRAAYVSPALFDRGVLRLQFLPLRPASATAWEGVLAISIPKQALAGARSVSAPALGATLQMGTRIVHQFGRQLTATGRQIGASDATPFTLLEPMTLSVARYAATVVLSDPAKVRPESRKIAFELPEIPRGKMSSRPSCSPREGNSSSRPRSRGPDSTSTTWARSRLSWRRRPQPPETRVPYLNRANRRHPGSIART